MFQGYNVSEFQGFNVSGLQCLRVSMFEGYRVDGCCRKPVLPFSACHVNEMAGRS